MLHSGETGLDLDQHSAKRAVFPIRLWTMHRLCTPVRGLTAAMLRLEGGEYETNVPALTRQDGVGALAQAVAVFKASAIKKDKPEIRESETRRLCDEQRAQRDERGRRSGTGR